MRFAACSSGNTLTTTLVDFAQFIWRLAREYERLCETGESMIYAPMSRVMLRLLARC
jgi:hypothetical protein